MGQAEYSIKVRLESMTAISVIVPIYNQEQYIAQCAQALQSQSISDFNVVFVDDGSTDNTIAQLQPYIDGNANFSLITQKNSGVSVARNRGMEHTQGDWIAFMDPDDLVTEDYLETLYNTAQQYPQADIVMSSCIAFNKTKQQRQYFYPHNFIARTDAEKIPLYHQLLDGGYQQPESHITAIGVPWGKLYKRTFIEKNDLAFNPRLKRMQDNLFNMKAFHDAKEIVYIDYAGYLYRVDDTTGRSYRNALRRVYRNALQEREVLMNEYRLKSIPELANAQQVETINLYFQEIRAAVLTAPHTIRSMTRAARMRSKELRPLVSNISSASLPKKEKLRKSLMQNQALATIYAMIKFVK